MVFPHGFSTWWFSVKLVGHITWWLAVFQKHVRRSYQAFTKAQAQNYNTASLLAHSIGWSQSPGHPSILERDYINFNSSLRAIFGNYHHRWFQSLSCSSTSSHCNTNNKQENIFKWCDSPEYFYHYSQNASTQLNRLTSIWCAKEMIPNIKV